MKIITALSIAIKCAVLVQGFVLMATVMLLLLFVVHCTWVTSNAYSSPSVVLASYNSDG